MARLLLPGVQRVRPYGQGGLDYLCGLYAAINAINVVLAPHAAFGRSAARHLFEQGIAELDARRLLTDAVSEGIGIEEQYRLTLRLAAATSARVGVPLSVTRPTADAKPFRRHTLLNAVDDALDAGAAVIICLQGGAEHYTVIVGRGAGRYSLLDSNDRQWIARQSVGTESGSVRRYRIAKQGIAAICITQGASVR